MLTQQREARALRSPVERISFVVQGSLAECKKCPQKGSLRFVPAVGLAAIGSVGLLAATLRAYSQSGRLAAEAVVFLTLFTYFVGTSMSIHVAWYRYLIPTFLFSALLTGLGVSVIVGQLPRAWAMLRRPRTAQYVNRLRMRVPVQHLD